MVGSARLRRFIGKSLEFFSQSWPIILVYNARHFPQREKINKTSSINDEVTSHMLKSLCRKFTTSPDVLIIGGGPGGYVATIRAAQLGLKAVCVEKENLMGGTCLREGCIPSKYLLNIAHKVNEIDTELTPLGISVNGKASFDLNKIQRRKTAVLSGLSKGIEHLINQYGAHLEHGFAKINDPHSISVTNKEGKEIVYNPKNLILATGSEVFNIPSLPVDGKVILNSNHILDMKNVPKTLVVIGAGVIGLEMACVWNALGSKVILADMANNIGGVGIDKGAAKVLFDALKRRKMDFFLGAKSTSAVVKGNMAEVKIGDKVVNADKVLVSIGRRPFLKGFGFENLGVKLNKYGIIEVNEKLQTNIPNVYAIGDIVPGPQLAHKAEEEGVACVEIIAGKRKEWNGTVIPAVIYTFPEIASVGITEEEAKQQNIKIKTSVFPYQANSRARAVNQTTGFVKFICDENGKVLGNHIIGANAGEAIMEATLAMSNNINIKELAETCHPHPTLSEAIMESAKGVLGKPIHL